MARKSVQLAYIRDEYTRRSSMKKRMDSLKKKLNELSTLCGIDACAIIYGPDDATEPEVWPNTVGVQRVVARFSKMSEYEQSKNMQNLEKLLEQRLGTTIDAIEKLDQEIHDREISLLVYDCMEGKRLDDISPAYFDDMKLCCQKKMAEISARMEFLEETANSGNARNAMGMEI